MNKLIHFLIVFILLVSCNQYEKKESNNIKSVEKDSSFVSNTAPKLDTVKKKLKISQLEQQLINAGLVNIKQVDSSIMVDLKYATKDNFLNKVLYDSLSNCYMLPDVAEKLALAQFLLKSEYPHLSLKIYDAVRPRSVQQKMWNMLDMPAKEKTKYVSNPKNGSLHNFGAAVDLTIVDSVGNELDMGTAYDYFGKLAYPRLEKEMLTEGRLNQLQLNNRLILRNAMQEAGFMPITTEWWHFNACYRKDAWQKYKIVE